MTNDVELNGVAFNVVPGTYQRTRRKPLVAGKPPTRKLGRAEFGPFGRGALQAVAVDEEQGWEALNVAPVYDGMGVEPFPSVAATADAMVELPSTTKRAYTVIAGTNAFVGVGQRIYKSVALTNGTWAAFTAAADLGAGFTISGMAYYLGDILVMLSTGQDIRKFNVATSAVSIWRTGEKGVNGVAYAGQLMYAPRVANNEEELRLSGTKWNGNAITHLRYLDAPIVTMASFGGKVAIATKKSLYLMGGQPYPGEADDATVTADTSKAPLWIGEPEPLMTHGTFAEGDDFVFLESYRGKLYTWLGGRVAEYDGGGENWHRMGPEGINCYGATVAADWLIVAITNRLSGSFELWGFNGEGWWTFAQRTSAQARYIWPGPLASAGDRDLICFRDGGGTYDLFRLRWRSTTFNTYATTGTWASSLIDGGDPTRDKTWRGGGTILNQPANRGNAASVDAVTLPVEYSTDGGVTWVNAVSQNASSGGTRVFTRTFAFGTPPESRTIQIRQRWTSVSDWAPVLTKAWIDFEFSDDYELAELAAAAYAQALLDEDVPRRRWELTLGAGDGDVRRDGQVDTLTGRQKIAAVWDAWELAAPVTFKDIDNDADPTTYSVEIVDIEERAPKPSDSGHWGESVVKLVLQEAAPAGFSSLFGVYSVGTLLIDENGAITLPVIPETATVVEGRIEPEGGATTDTLTAIIVSGTVNTGLRLLLRTVSSVRDVVVTDSGAGATGNLRLASDVNYTLAATTNAIILEHTSTNVWTERARW